MTSMLADWQSSAAKQRDWALSSVRPVTLLIASGIVLIAAILILTGIVAGHLREQALLSARGELSRLDAVLAVSAGRSLHNADLVLQSLAERIGQDPGEPVPNALAQGLGGVSPFGAVAAFGSNGAVLGAAGNWSPAAADSGEDALVAELREHRADAGLVVLPVYDTDGGGVIPVARRITGISGAASGFVVGFLPVRQFETLFAAVPGSAGEVVSLVHGDDLLVISNGSGRGNTQSASFLRLVSSDGGDGELSLQATRPLPGYPLSVVVSRNGASALDQWAHQAMLLGALAMLGAIGVGAMIFMITRQFRIHAALASVRAEKIESEHARLLTEAELLKKERLSVLGQLTATVAHELRNPLSAIRNTLFSVKEMANGSALKLDRPIGRMERSIDRCNRIIGDLLEYARTRELRRTAVDLEAWLKDVLTEQTVPATVSLVEDFHSAGATVAIDGERIRRVVINLIDNAAQALGEMPEGSGERRITIRTAAADDAVELKVEDNGPGILPEHRARIFEPLFSTKSFGTGLGLATVKQIVGQHGGTIDVDSEIGGGTCFTIRLPREEAKVAA